MFGRQNMDFHLIDKFVQFFCLWPFFELVKGNNVIESIWTFSNAFNIHFSRMVVVVIVVVYLKFDLLQCE